MTSIKPSIPYFLTRWKRRPTKIKQEQGWSPPALRWWILTVTTLLCWIFIAILQWLLHRSQSEGGIIFASDINSLPLHRSFSYLYLPTITAVVFSIWIVWIDHDAKRFEPFRQMAKAGGALGHDSMLLQYPFDFMPFVPFVAAKRKHWLVFWSSLTTLLVNFGVVPLQAGIFSTETIQRASSLNFMISKDFMPASTQEKSLSLVYAQSAYAILELNETMPAYMTRNYTLKPFTTSEQHPKNLDGTWTVNTTMYSLGLECEPGRKGRKRISESDFQRGFNSSFGCFVGAPAVSDNVIGETGFKTYSAEFMGHYVEHDNFWGRISNIFPNLENRCLGHGKGAFFALFTRNKSQKSDPPQNVTTMFCKPSYFEQDVEVTVHASTKRPLSVVPHGDRRRLAQEMFNTTVFEETLAAGQRQTFFRDDGLPGYMVPRYLEQVVDSDLTPWVDDISDSSLPPMAAMAAMASRDHLSDLTDYRGLINAYTLVYQLLFARAMNDILDTDFAGATNVVSGNQLEKNTGAVFLEPLFTYVVEVLLGIVSLATIMMLYISYSANEKGKLPDDPGPLATIVSMVADDDRLLDKFNDSGIKVAGKMRYHLGATADCHAISLSTDTSDQQQPLLDVGDSEPRREEESMRLHRPTVFRLFAAIPFTSLIATLLVATAVLFHRARLWGLPLPSNSRIIQNLVADYLPTAMATLIEPMWILISRLLCVLQPLRDLQSTRAAAAQPLALAYSSLPPQLIAFKAARNGHTILAMSCVMALLANILATSFAGLFVRDFVQIPRSTEVSAPYTSQFTMINGSVGPPISSNSISWRFQSGAYRGGLGADHFLLAESNYTRNTSLPSWTDEYAAYVPYMTANTSLGEREFEARTRYFTAELECRSHKFGDDYKIEFGEVGEDSIKINITGDSGENVTCYAPEDAMFGYALGLGRSRMTYEKSCRTGKLAAELLTSLEAHINDTSSAKPICSSSAAIGWTRASMYNCTDGTSEPLPEARSDNTIMLSCQPRVKSGYATIHVDAAGVLQRPARALEPDQDQSYSALEKYFASGPESLIQQSNLFIMRSSYSSWHNDTYASEYLQYFTNRATGHQRFSDPSEPLPSFEDVIEPLSKAYTRLFAIWLGVNLKFLLEPVVNGTEQSHATVMTHEERLVFVKSLFIMSEVILGIYFITLILLYIRRPGRYLLRQPTSIGAIIKLFGSSTVVKDVQGTSSMTNKSRKKLLVDMGHKYRYGRYTAKDGSEHIGIEKERWVRPLHDKNLRNDERDVE